MAGRRTNPDGHLSGPLYHYPIITEWTTPERLRGTE